MNARGRSDVLIVGAGHNGLVAACYLQRAGLRVTVLEKNDYPGGMAASRPFLASAPEHVLSPGAYENAFLRASGVIEDLALARHGYAEHESAGWAWLSPDGGSIVFQRDLEATVRDISRHSPRDARAYRDLMEVAVKGVAIQGRLAGRSPLRPGVRETLATVRTLCDRRARSTLAGMVASTAAEVISSTFDSDAVRGAFAHMAVVIIGALLAEGSGIALLCPGMLHARGTARPVGGMGGFIAALESALRAAGGEVRTRSLVTEVLTVGERARGVRLASGEVVEAERAVITAMTPQRVPELVPGLDPHLAGRMRSAPANSGGVAALTASLALSGQVQLPAHHRDDIDLRRPLLFTGGFDAVMAAWAEAARGTVPTAMPWWAAIFTAVDFTQAPEGQDVLQLYTPAPVRATGGWDEHRDPAAQRLVTQAGSVLAGLEDREIGRYVETPDDLDRRTGAVNGCLYHVDHVPTRLGPLRPALGVGGYRTPLEGLYLTGAGTHPNGGVTGLPGKHAAHQVLRDLRSRRQQAKYQPVGPV